MVEVSAGGGVEVVFGTVETIGTVGTDVACEPVSWSFAGSGSIGVIGILGTIETVGTGAVCGLVSWSFAGSGVVGVVGTVETVGTVGTGDAGAVEGSSTGYWARQGWPGRV